MRKNRMMRLASALLILTMVTTCAISGTFAKYTSEKTASDSARVAKWSFTVNGTDIATTDMTFDLFNTVKDTKDGNTEGDISATDGTIIAPGTKGSFDIVLTNASEVTAEYKIDYTVTNANNIPVQFSTDGTNWEDSIDELDVTTPVTVAIGATAPTVTVHWMWAFEGNDSVDTTLGTGGTATVKVDAKITATQVD